MDHVYFLHKDAHAGKEESKPKGNLSMDVVEHAPICPNWRKTFREVPSWIYSILEGISNPREKF